MYTLEKCWEIKECRDKERCPAYPHFGRSCWLITGKLRFLAAQQEVPPCHGNCESCEVYLWHEALLTTGQRFSRRKTGATAEPFL
jgi:hypothetical protein